jgi:hypothetical protein
MKNKIILTDFRENFAKELRKNPKNLDYFIKDSVEQYEEVNAKGKIDFLGFQIKIPV